MGKFHPVIFFFSFYILKYSFYACLRNKCKLLESKLQGDFNLTSVWLFCGQVGMSMGVRKWETRRGEEGNKEGRGGKQLHQVQNFKSGRRQRQVWTQLEGSAGDVAGSGSNSGLPW